jgi:GWxTD domain-containing protein
MLIAGRLREMRSVEGRTRSLALLEDMYKRHPDRSDVGIELARTLIAASRPGNALEVLTTVASRDTTDVESRLLASRLMIREMLYYGHRRHIDSATRMLEQAQTIEPRNREILFQRSALIYLMREFDPNPARLSKAARALTEEALRIDDTDQDPRAALLNGVHCLDLWDEEDAEYWFKKGIRSLPIDVAFDFLVPPALGPAFDSLKTPRERKALLRRFWEEQDSTPLDPGNPTLLRYWRNMTIADLYYGDPEKGTYGWRCDAGQSIVLFGPPVKTDFDPGVVDETGYTPPRLLVLYESGPRLSFESLGLDAKWHSRGSTSGILRSTVKSGAATIAPPVPPDAPSIFVAHAAARHADGYAREGCVIAVPPWSRGKDWWKGSIARLSVVDTTFQVASKAEFLVDEEDLHEIEPGRRGFVIGHDFKLRPGIYTLVAEVTKSRDGGETSTMRVPITVPVFDRAALRLSEPEIVVTGTYTEKGIRLEHPPRPYIPNALRAVGSDGRFDVAYSVYNLTPDAHGRGLYEVAYMLVPTEERRYEIPTRKKTESEPEDSLHFSGMPRAREPVALPELDRQKIDFSPVEVRRAKPGGEVRKLASLSLRSMPDGDYLVRIIVTDKVLDQTVMAETRIRKVTDAVLDSLLSPSD